MAGGTGGHVFPALAVADWLRTRGVEVVWMGTRNGMEARIVPEAGIPMEWVQVGGLRGKGASGWLVAPLRLTRALYQAVAILMRRRPQAVLGMGGFVAGPGGVASWLMRTPLLIHEQNAIPGLTNRLLVRLAKRVMEAFPGSFEQTARAIQTGNPVRREIVALPDPVQRALSPTQSLKLLVVGGSLGAIAINDAVPAAVAQIDPGRRPAIWHQAGYRNVEATRTAYGEAGVEARVEAFIDDMAAAYRWADVVLCRSGALTISELAAAGIPALLVPYPHAVDDHQTANARWLVEAGGARLIPQPLLNASNLAEQITQLDEDRTGLDAMASAARQVAMVDATERVATACLEIAGITLDPNADAPRQEDGQ